MRKLITIAGIAVSPLALGLLSTAPASASTPDPAVWIGSPINGHWPTATGCAGAIYPSDSCSLPTVHHTVYYSSFDWGTTVDDWAADDQGVVPGERVMLYA